jgi:transposase
VERAQLIRHKVLVERHGIKQTAAELGVCRNTVRKYVRESEPCRKRRRSRSRPVWEPVKPRLNELLAQSSGVTMKSLTSSQLHRQLVAEGYRVSSRLIRKYLPGLRRQHRQVDQPSGAQIGAGSAAGEVTAQQPIARDPVTTPFTGSAAIMRCVEAARGGAEVESSSPVGKHQFRRGQSSVPQPDCQPRRETPIVESPISWSAVPLMPNPVRPHHQ